MWRLARICLLCSYAGWSLAAGQVHLLLSDSGPAYQEVADAFIVSQGQRPYNKWQVDDLGEAQLAALSNENDLLVPIGIKASRLVAKQYAGNASVLALMVPRQGIERLSWPASLARRKLSSVYVDQPVSRSLDMIAAVWPERNRIGVVVSRDNQTMIRMVEQDAARRGKRIESRVVDVSEDVGPTLRGLLPEIELLLLLPDVVSLNATNLQNILLAAYRQRVPVVGFSSGQVKAGAALAVFSSPAQIGRQGGRLAEAWSPKSGDLPAAQASAEYSVSVNRQVSRSLDLSIPDEREIQRRMKAVE